MKLEIKTIWFVIICAITAGLIAVLSLAQRIYELDDRVKRMNEPVYDKNNFILRCGDTVVIRMNNDTIDVPDIDSYIMHREKMQFKIWTH